MNPLDILFGTVANAVQQHSSPNTPGPAYDANPILGALSGIFGQHAQQQNQPFNGYNPNADYSQHSGTDIGSILGGLGGMFGGGQSQGQGNVLPASQDPYGDPADQGGGGFGANVRPASEDPYGDPADQR